jgi:hypothetical protein
MNLRKLMPLSGLVFIALLAAAFILGSSTPDPHASAQSVASFYDAHSAREIAASFALAAALPFFVLFAVALIARSWPARADGAPVWHIVLAVGSAVTGAAVLLGATAHFALADGAGHVSGTALQALNLIDGDIWMAFNPALGLTMLGAAGVLIAGTVDHHRLGWCAIVLGIALFIPFVDFFALLATGVWIVTASVVISRQPTAVQPAATAYGQPSPVPHA